MDRSILPLALMFFGFVSWAYLRGQRRPDKRTIQAAVMESQAECPHRDEDHNCRFPQTIIRKSELKPIKQNGYSLWRVLTDAVVWLSFLMLAWMYFSFAPQLIDMLGRVARALEELK